MAKGRPVVIAGTEYEPKPRARSGSKRKGGRIIAPARKRRALPASISGSGDYVYRGATPFHDIGSVLGGGASYGLNMLGIPTNASMFKSVGGRLGHAVGGIFGSGDYTVGGAPSVLTNGKELPKFVNKKYSNVICHREYLGDVKTGAANTFSNTSYNLNPGLRETFPWLSTIAQNYDQFVIHGMVFEYKTTSSDALNSTNTALGSVIMATQYNPLQADFQNKQEMENYEMAQSCKPSLSQLHGIECAKNQTPQNHLYVRTAKVPTGQDARWFDMGKFQIATTGFQAANVVIGELWVSYMVEFFKPKVPNSFGGNIYSSYYARTGGAAANPFGTATTDALGTLTLTVTNTTVTFEPDPNSLYLFTVYWQGTAAVIGQPTSTVTNAAKTQTRVGSADGVTSAAWMIQYLITSDSSNLPVTVTLATGGGLPTSSNVQIILTQVDDNFLSP